MLLKFERMLSIFTLHASFRSTRFAPRSCSSGWLEPYNYIDGNKLRAYGAVASNEGTIQGHGRLLFINGMARIGCKSSD